jgi:hypothetical protein
MSPTPSRSDAPRPNSLTSAIPGCNNIGMPAHGSISKAKILSGPSQASSTKNRHKPQRRLHGERRRQRNPKHPTMPPAPGAPKRPKTNIYDQGYPPPTLDPAAEKPPQAPEKRSLQANVPSRNHGFLVHVLTKICHISAPPSHLDAPALACTACASHWYRENRDFSSLGGEIPVNNNFGNRGPIAPLDRFRLYRGVEIRDFINLTVCRCEGCRAFRRSLGACGLDKISDDVAHVVRDSIPIFCHFDDLLLIGPIACAMNPEIRDE